MGEHVENHKDERAPLARRENFVDLVWEQIFFLPLLGTKNFVDLLLDYL